MDGFDAVIEEPEIGVEEQEPLEAPEQEPEAPEQQEGESDNKFSKRFTEWLKAQRNSGDPEVAKFARYAKDQEGRFTALKQLEPRGIDGVREKYAAIDGLQYGEAKGLDALGAIQDQIRDYEQSDELLAAGDPKVLDLFDEKFNDGLAKLTPAIIDRIQQSNPEAYSAAILPHLVSALRVSPMVQDFNGIVDVLNEQPPQWLTPDQKQHWINEKFQKIIQHANGMATWLNAQDQAVKGQKAPQTNGHVQPSQDKFAQERQQFEEQQKDYHWKTNIAPRLDDHAVKQFDALFRPYNQRLKLDQAAQDGLKKDFVSRVVEKSAQNRQYMSQIQRYRSQKNPDPATVLNLATVEFDKYAKGVINEIINERYRPFLGSKQNPTPNGVKQTTVNPQNGITYVSVKPPMGEIDHRNTPLDWLHQKKYRLTSGKVVQVRN